MNCPGQKDGKNKKEKEKRMKKWKKKKKSHPFTPPFQGRPKRKMKSNNCLPNVTMSAEFTSGRREVDCSVRTLSGKREKMRELFQSGKKQGIFKFFEV